MLSCFNNLAPQKKSFGLDISERVFRLVQLKKCRNKIKLISYGELAVPLGVLKDGKIVQIDKAVEIIHQLISQAQGQSIKTKYVVACLSELTTFIKLITLTYPDGKNIIEEIALEAKKHIPYPLEEVYLDWQYTSRNDKSKVLIGVCPKEIVENYQEVFIKAGLTPLALEIEATAIVRSVFLVKEKVTEPTMILDLGASRTGLIIYYNNAIPFSLSLPFSCDNLTKILKDKLKISSSDAELAKSVCGLNKAKAKGYTFELLKEEANQLAQHIREANYFYQEHFFEQKPVKKLYLTGSGSLIANLDKYLSNEVKMEVNYANPLINLTPNNLTIPPIEVTAYTTAIGLALRNFFLPK